ncbi:MAG TPA: ABC transporter permease [Bryobacteraceae bacterium]|nr:ABC transporter permease [Bryobacteraceae bacterium]
MLFADIRYALRGFRHSPVFTITAILTLALGVGGTTAIFSLIHSVMLRSLPVADPARLYRIGDGDDCCMEGGPQDRWGMVSFPLYEKIKANSPEFEELTAFQAGMNQFGVRRENVDRAPKPLIGEFVTGNYFSTLGIRPFAGRLFSNEDDRPSAPPVAVLSYNAWQGKYGGEPSAIGAAYFVEGKPFTVIGIAPPGFFGETLRSDPPEMWVPLQQEPMMHGGTSFLHQSITAWLRVIGRLRPGATTDGLSARYTGMVRQWMQYDAGLPAVWMPAIIKMLPRQQVNVVPAGAGVATMKEDYGRSLEILLSVCGLVLLIACANLANLLLARGMIRRSQTSLRLAIGASRGRIIGQSLTESLLLAIAGGIAGLVIADGAQRLLLALAFRDSHAIPISTTPSLPILAFAFALSLVTGILFGTAPAWLATRTDPVQALRGVGRSTSDSSSLPRKLLLVFQATLSVVLVAGATMLTRSLNNLQNQSLGLETHNRVSIALNPPSSTYPIDRLDAIYRELELKLTSLPGVERASLALYNPFTDNWGELVFVAGHPMPVLSENSTSSWDRVNPEYFQAVGQPILRGRGLTSADRGTANLVAVVNEAFAKRFLPNEDPLDKHFGLDLAEYANTFRIVGVVRDAKYNRPDQPARPMFFVPLAQYVDSYQLDIMRKVEMNSHFIHSAMLVTNAPPGSLEPLLRRVFAEVDPNLTVNSVRTMQEQVALSFDQDRAVAGLASLFGIIALVLAAVGLYGVTAYTVARRTSEIGVRMALGAGKQEVVGLVLRGAFTKVAAGLMLGVPLAIGAGHLMASRLYRVPIWDPWSLFAAVAALGGCALIAAIIPALRASNVDPLRALRME